MESISHPSTTHPAASAAHSAGASQRAGMTTGQERLHSVAPESGPQGELDRKAAEINGTAIPEMSHPWSKHWPQPDPREILVDSTHAVMSLETFRKLPEYSCTLPSGVYEGKMWRRREPYSPEVFGVTKWYLMWYGPSEDPLQCSINHRQILLA